MQITRFDGRQQTGQRKAAIEHFSSQSVLGMIGLSIVTLGFYIPFWMRRVSGVLNVLLPANRIGAWFFPVSMGLTLLSVLLWAGGMEGNLVNSASFVVGLVWAFKIRNRMNSLLEAERTTELWFKGPCTFLFTSLYIQFKINKLKAIEPSIGGESEARGTRAEVVSRHEPQLAFMIFIAVSATLLVLFITAVIHEWV